MGRFVGVSSANAGAVFSPPFEIGFLLDSWLNANACLAGVTADTESGFFGVAVACKVVLLVVGMFSDIRIWDAGSPLLLDGDGVTGASSGKNRGGAETRARAGGFLGVTALRFKICGWNAFSKITGRT